MTARFLLASAAIAALTITTALAQTPAQTPQTQGAPGDAIEGDNPGGFNMNNVAADRPFGEIDVGGAGADAPAVNTYLGGLTGAQVIELIQRCGVVRPMQMAANMNAAGMGNTPAAGGANAGANAGAAAGGNAAMPGGANAGAAAGGAAGANAGAAGGANAGAAGGANAGAAAGGANAGAAAGAAGGANAGAAAGGAAAGGANAGAGMNAGAAATMPAYAANDTTFCTNLQTVLFGNRAAGN